jgi:cytochrome oxidase Cu insertion factor (SCO1/SenC/PrrC family)
LIRLPPLLFGLSLALAVCAAMLVWHVGSSESGSGVEGSALIGGPFALTDQHGKTRTERDFRGRWLLVYFGYTYCPDTCPTTLQEIADAFRRLGPESHDIVPVFITLDPARDSPAVLRKYLAAFGPEFVGLTGAPAQIAAVAHAYRMYYAKHPLSGGGYAIDHASAIYLMAPDGRFASLLDEQQGASGMAKELHGRL